MHTKKLYDVMNYISIENQAEFQSYVEGLEDKKNNIMALDIEAESNLHAYGEKLCLIQIFDGVNNIIIDPITIDNDILKTLFENINILKVMYDASSDLSLLKNTANIEIKSLLDLRPAVELLNYDRQDLHSVIACELGVFLEKKRKYQKHNWTKRPLHQQAIDYALNDVIHLLKLKDALFKKLCSNNLLDRFLLKNLQIQNKDYIRDPKDKYRNIKGYGGLQDNEKTIFRRAFDIRDKYARRYNMPANNIIHNSNLLSIVKDAQCINEIHFPHRFTEGLIHQILRELKSVIIPH